MKFVCTFLAMIAAENALASGAAHGGSGIPASVMWQAINFVIFAFLLWFLLRKKVPAYFAERAAHFEVALKKAEKARQEAEAQKQEIEKRLHALQTSADQSIVKAKGDADELRQKIIRDAQALSEHLIADARRTAEIELQRAKTELREEVLAQAVVAAKALLNEKIVDTDQKRLQSEFVEKIQVVR
ncbi:MAG: ATP synthase F0 subunit B [Bdellovibrionaceae bacterium]|nr:ATP synthase F0 subunit B [Pseudobdellovibrionaceae bacterium]